MLNPFPELLFLQEFAPMLVRTAIGVYFLLFAWTNLKKGGDPAFLSLVESFGLRPAKTYGIILGCVQIVIGGCLILGFMTQIAAMLAALSLLKFFVLKLRYHDKIAAPVSVYVLLFIMSISLIITGAGIPAIDLPL